MGLWDVFDYAVKKPVTKAYQCTYDLGRAAVSKTVDGAVQIPTVTKSVLTSSYAFGCAAVSKIDERYGNDGVKQKVKEYFPGTESREKIIQVFTHPVTQEAIKLVAPGRAQAAYNIVVGSVLLGNSQNENDIDEQNKYEHGIQVIQQLKVLQAEIEKMQKQIKQLQLQVMMTSTNNSSSTVLSEQNPEEQNPEEVMTLS